MRFLEKTKDGGPNSPVDIYHLFEIKWLGGVALIKFNKGCRENMHTHAFHAWTWFLWGRIWEQKHGQDFWTKYKRSWWPKVTRRDNNHKVHCEETSWCFTIRGPWAKTWTETEPNGVVNTLEHGRKVVSRKPSKPVTLEVGKSYVSDTGKVFGPMRKYDDKWWTTEGHSPYLWRTDGLGWFDHEGRSRENLGPNEKPEPNLIGEYNV